MLPRAPDEEQEAIRDRDLERAREDFKHAGARIKALEKELEQALSDWTCPGQAQDLMALRGVDTLTAITVLAELGDITRFDTSRQLMAYVGLVPSEHSSGQRRQRGAITKAGNAHVRRVLVESAWCYRFPARKTRQR